MLHDDLFAPNAVPVDARQVFELSDAMRQFADTQLVAGDRRRALSDALYKPDGGLRLGYDTGVTRTASEAFDLRAGNCLSLVILAAALAKHIGVPVQYRSVITDEEYSRSGDLFLAAGHINIVLGRRSARSDTYEAPWLTVDFAPQTQLAGQRSVPVEEPTVVAMFMNNRAAEALTSGRVHDAYWWAREAVLQDPRFLPGINTLGVVYQRAQRPAEAEHALRHVLSEDADNVNALTNLAHLVRAQGRESEASALDAQLSRLQSTPPLWYFDRGREALAAGDATKARDLLLTELRRQPFQHEVHFLLAQVYATLGDRTGAERHLARAQEYGPTLGLRGLYAAKLERLRGHPVP